jgi:hypothetical protein
MANINKAQSKLAEDIAETEEAEAILSYEEEYKISAEDIAETEETAEVILSYKEETWMATTDA